jgi:hypothetical protein
MPTRNRRLGVRVPLTMFLTQYIRDKPVRALTSNLSEHGAYLNLVKGGGYCRGDRVVGLEFELPGTGEVIWARGEVCYDQIDSYFHGTGVRFAAMARAHARLLRDYCVEHRREQLSALLERIRQPVAA